MGWGNWRTRNKYFNYFYTLYFHQTAQNLLFYSGWLSCHDPCAISSKLQHQRAATLDPVWPQIEIRIMACWRVEGAEPSPAQPGPSEADLLSRNSCLISPFFTRLIIGCQIFLFAPLPFYPPGPWLQCGHMTNTETVHSYHSIPVLPLAVK